MDTVTVVAVVERDRGEDVVERASGLADELGTDLHVVHVIGLSWYHAIELALAERIGIPVRTETVAATSERVVDDIVGEAVEDYRAVGLVGRPTTEITRYASSVDADAIVIAADHFQYRLGLLRDSIEAIERTGIPVITV